MKNQKDPIYYQDASTLAEMIRTKQISSVEVVQAHLDRIEELNPQLNAVVTLMGDEALRAAAEADNAVANGDKLGPLHGVPFSIKDTIDTAGVPSQRGSNLFAGFEPEKDATVVSRMKGAGAIPIMKTNVPEFASWWETDNLLTGRTNNPWDLNRTPGGSSGGESAAIAAGLSPIGLGSDVAISLRGPGAFTGVAALKATHGRVPLTGHYPQSLNRFWHIGPMARTVKDVALGYSILNGADGFDGYSIYAKDAVPFSFRAPGQKIRVGWVSETAFGPVDAEISAAVEKAAALLKDLGCDVEEVRLPFMEENDYLTPYLTLYYGEIIPYVKKFATGREAGLHFIGEGLMTAAMPSLEDYVAGEVKIEELKNNFAAYFQQYDVLLCPVNPITAQPHALSEYVINGITVPATHVMRATSPHNMTGLPALSVPFTQSSEKMPINIQLVSSWFDEATILELGQQIQEAGDAVGKHPIL